MSIKLWSGPIAFVGSLFSCLRGLLTYFDVERRGVLLCYAWESSWDDGKGWAFSVDYEARMSSGGPQP